MRNLSEMVTLPFLAAFDVDRPRGAATSVGKESRVVSRVTYIGLAKKVMPMLLNIFVRFKEQVRVYEDGTLESVLSVS